jgi:ribose 5-phosphate isomerase B
MRIAIANDHAGFSLRATVIETVKKNGHEVLDFGIDENVRVDFPDFAQKACTALQDGKADRAILICGSGVGMCIAANKFKGVYAAICHDSYSAHQGVEHDGMNTLCLGARVIGIDLAVELVNAFLNAGAPLGGRYAARVDKIKSWED